MNEYNFTPYAGPKKETGIDWFGPAPMTWSKTTLAYMGKYINGAAFKPEDWGTEGIPILRIAQLTGKPFDNFFTGVLNQKLKVRPGDLLFSWSATIDSFIWENGDAWLNQHIFRVIPSQEASKKYLYYLIKAVAPKLAEFDAHGSTMRHIKKESLKERVFIPSLANQSRIAATLDRETARIDALIEKKTRFIELLKEKRQALITQAVTKGLTNLPGANLNAAGGPRGEGRDSPSSPTVPMKDSGVEWIGEVPAGWDVVPVKRFCDVRDGTHATPKYVDRSDNTFALVTTRHLEGGSLKLGECNHISESDYREVAKRSEVHSGDILMPMIGTIGGAVVFRGNEKFAIKNVALFKSNPTFNPDWLALALQSEPTDRQFDFLRSGGVQSFVGLSTLRNLVVCYPPVSEQNAILNGLREPLGKLERLLERSQTSVSLLQERRSALITAAVTGQIDLREDAA